MTFSLAGCHDRLASFDWQILKTREEEISTKYADAIGILFGMYKVGNKSSHVYISCASTVSVWCFSFSLHNIMQRHSP